MLNLRLSAKKKFDIKKNMYLCRTLNYVTNYLFGLKLTERELLTKQPSDVIHWGNCICCAVFGMCDAPKTPPPLGRKKREKLKYKIE